MSPPAWVVVGLGLALVGVCLTAGASSRFARALDRLLERLRISGRAR